MRFKNSQEQQQYLKHASSCGNVEPVFAGLDVSWLDNMANQSQDFRRRARSLECGLLIALENYCLPYVKNPNPKKTAEMETDQKA